MSRYFKNHSDVIMAIFIRDTDDFTKFGAFVQYLNPNEEVSLTLNNNPIVTFAISNDAWTTTSYSNYGTRSSSFGDSPNSDNYYYSYYDNTGKKTTISTIYDGKTWNAPITTDKKIWGYNTSAGNYVSIFNYNVNTDTKKSYTIDTSNLKNCTTDSTLTYDEGSSGTLIITPNDGYEWGDNKPYLTNGLETIAQGKINSDGTASISFTNISSNLKLYGACTEIPVAKVTIAQNFTGCYTESQMTYNVGASGTINLKLNDGYEWDADNLPVLTTITQESDGLGGKTNVTKTIATATIDANEAVIKFTDIPDNATLTATAKVQVKTAVIRDGNLTNCTCSHTPEGSPLTVGTEVTFTFTPNNGYEFSGSQPYIRYSNNIGDFDYAYATIADDKASATLTHTIGQYDTIISCNGTAEVKPEIPTTSYDFINVYNCTRQNIKDLAKYRFVVASSDNPYNIVDLAYYITSLRKFYCDIPTSISANIVMATIDSKISAKLVSQDEFNIDCGQVTVESTNNNVNDYNNTTCELYLPFIGIVTVDSTKIIGRTLKLSYKVSSLSGDCKAFVVDNETGFTLYEYEGNISDTIPYILNNIDWQMKGELPNSQLIDSFVPYVLITYHNNYNENDTTLLNDNKYDLLSNLTGLNCVNNVIIQDTSIPDDEKEYITNALESGVIF